MGNFGIIQQKLEAFIRKYYTNELIKGAILFFAIGLLYLLIILLIEYFLWLAPLGRTILFWTFIVFEIGLFLRFIVFPLAKLFRFRKGIGYEDASRIIGNHFPQVSDKLLNVIQLNQNKLESELLAASIDQKAAELQPIPFQSAVNFRKNAKYLKYAAIPILVFVLFSTFGGMEIFSSSYSRVVRYDTAFEPPAPFSFIVVNEDLNAIEGKPFNLQVRTDGNVIPENAAILFSGETYYMHQIAPGFFEYTFSQPVEPLSFMFRANAVSSRDYRLDVIKTPSLLDLEMLLDYPAYTNKQDETIKGNGSAVIPEGTKVHWRISARNTKSIALKTIDTVYDFSAEKDRFKFEKGVFNKLDYTITTSNENLKDYENLAFTLNVVKDQFPEISVQSKIDSTNINRTLFLGQVSDDYGLTRLRVVYYPEGKSEHSEQENLPISKSNFDQFTYVFPGNLPLEEGVSYEYYFEIFDNDALHNHKSTKSGIYSFRKLTSDELENEQLRNQQQAIQGLDNSLEELREHKQTLDELSRTQKEKNELNYNDRKKLENFIQRQQRQEELMKDFSKKLKDELEQFQPENKENDPFKEQLEKRLDENEERLKENEKLLDELEKLQDKIQKEELTDKLEKLAKQNKNQERNLEQLLELTKRYYVEKKAEKLMEELLKMGEEQEKLSERSEQGENTEKEQKELNEAFDAYKEEMDKLQEENQELKKPLDIPKDEQTEGEIDQEQQNATDKLENQEPEGASGNQKNAGQKMKQIAQKMQQQMQSGQTETLDEDVRMLRQILDNLVVFSFGQEDLMETFTQIKYGHPIFGKKLQIQNELKLNFQHIDDSLFALSLRQPLLGDKINSTLTEIQYNVDKSLERLADNIIQQGISNQRYTITGSNDLAVLLDDLLGNMQMQLAMASGGGSGQPKPGSSGEGEFQLPDIIQKQESLNQKMGEGMEKGSEGGKGEGEGEGEGNEGAEGDGQSGNSGNGGQGQGEQEGENGFGDDLNGELFEIYKQQQMLRQQLQDRMSKEGLEGDGGRLLKKMEGIEQQLLDKGFNQGTLQEMLNLKYELLKLDEATFEQGFESRRESQTNRRDFRNNTVMDPEEIKQFFNSVEILNRESLPLRQDYKNKVQDYFRTTDD